MLKQNGAWVDAQTHGGCLMQRFRFQLRVKWFRLCLQHWLKVHGIQVVIAILRPNISPLFSAQIGCVSIPIHCDRLETVDRIIQGNIKFEEGGEWSREGT